MNITTARSLPGPKGTTAKSIVASFILVSASGCYGSRGDRRDADPDTFNDPSTDLPDSCDDPISDGIDPLDHGADMTSDPWGDDPVEEPPACQPPGDIAVSFVVDGDWSTGDIAIEMPCLVTDVAGERRNNPVFELACENGSGIEEQHTIEITTDPDMYTFVNLFAGNRVFLKYRTVTSGWSSRWLSLRTDDEYGDIRVLGVDASDLAPPGVDADAWWSTGHLFTVEGTCPLVPSECSIEERAALGFAYSWGTRYMYDHSLYTSGLDREVFLERAVIHHDISCDGIPDRWFRMLYLGEYPTT